MEVVFTHGDGETFVIEYVELRSRRDRAGYFLNERGDSPICIELNVPIANSNCSYTFRISERPIQAAEYAKWHEVLRWTRNGGKFETFLLESGMTFFHGTSEGDSSVEWKLAGTGVARYLARVEQKLNQSLYLRNRGLTDIEFDLQNKFTNLL